MTGMSQIDALRLAGFEHQLDLDLDHLATLAPVSDRRVYTYLFSYPHLIDHVSGFQRLTMTELIAANAMVYGLMPTAMNFRQGDPEALVGPLNALRDSGQRLNSAQFATLRSVLNNSVSGTSKLLHVLRPDIYPIWDSRINRFLHGDDRNSNSLEKYRDYLADFDRVAAGPDFEPLRASLERKLGYGVTAARAFEMIMYLADLFGLDHLAPPAQPPVVVPAPQPRDRPEVPKFKRDAYTFISNLGPVTLDPDIPDTLRRDGYLLSEHYTSSATLKLAALARARRNLLISDNGNWTRMSAIARQFNDAGAALLGRAENEVAGGGLTDQTREDRRALIAEVAQACERAQDALDLSAVIDTQLQMQPDYMIGLEDFTVPVLMMIGLMQPVFEPDAAEIMSFQDATRRLFARQMAGEFGFKQALHSTAMFLVLHSFDYASAKIAAQSARLTQKDGLAISYGAPMASRRWISQIKIEDVVEDLGETLPESYLAAHALTLGVVNGHPDDVPIHILGVGTPILVMMIGFLLKHSRAVSIDSSAPMLDAFDGRIYGTKQAFLKMRMYRLAAISLVADTPYTSNTPFFAAFSARHPSDWAGLRNTLGVMATSDPREIEQILESDQALVRAHIPFFTRLTSSADPFFWDLRVSRAGHNYWVLRKIVDHIRRRRDDWPALRAWTEQEIARYVAVGHPKWARAVEASFELTVKHKLLDGLG